jgi:hypothetical protein
MDSSTISIDPVAVKLRRVGRLARRRMRIDSAALRNGSHTDGTLKVEISGLGSPAAGVPASFSWSADRPIALVIVRAGIDGDEVSFDVGPSMAGVGRAAGIGDGAGIRYVAFCYDAPIESTARPAGLLGTSVPAVLAPAAASASSPSAGSPPAFAPTGRERRSILSLLLDGTRRRSIGGSLA